MDDGLAEGLQQTVIIEILAKIYIVLILSKE